jgi:hypothetical protein
MQAAMATDAPSGIPLDMLMAAMDECCNDSETIERTGQACKSAPVCSVPVADTTSFPMVALLIQGALGPPEPAGRELPPGAASLLLRPPSPV